MLVVSFAEAQGREEGLAGSLASLRDKQDIGLPQVEGEIQFERSHLGEKGIPCGKVSKQDPGDVRKDVRRVREESTIFRTQAMRW